MAFLRFSILAFRVLLWVLLASLVVFVLASGSGVVHERNRALEAAHRDVVDAVNQALPTVSISLWQYDTSGLGTLARGLVQTDSLIRVEISDHRGVVASAAQSGVAAGGSVAMWTVPVKAPEAGKEIGYVRIFESHAAVEERLRDSVGTLILVELIKIGGLAIILFVIVYRKVARHLHDLAVDVGKLAPGDEAPHVEVRRKKLGHYRDEFDILVDAINRFLIERAEEIGRRTVAEVNLRQRVSEVETMLGALSDGVIGLDASRQIRYANRAACKLLGLDVSPPAGVVIEQLLAITDDACGDLTGLFADVIEFHKSAHYRGNVVVRPVSAEPFEAKISAVPVPDSGDVAMIFVFTDISAEIAKERKIEFQAFHDPLTKLGNRSMLARDLQLDIAAAAHSGLSVAVLCIDLDNFKNINDALGHMIGDVLLRDLAERFRQEVKAPGWVTRHGGDEFIVVLPQLAESEAAIRMARRLMDEIARPFHIEGHQLRVTSSIGISFAPAHGASIVQLVSCADLAMYAAKHDGKNAWRVFEDSLLRRSTERLAMENGLRVAILENQFSLVFQPKMNLKTGRVDAVEALIRWLRPGYGNVPPVAFIPVAEDTGLINEIGAWVLQESCEAARRIRLAVGRDVAVAVNVSPVQFHGDALMQTLEDLAQANPDLRGLIEIELTESALSGEIGEVVAKLEAVRLLGLRVAIDDFGTGYSSLAYLKNLPVDILKIDQAFVRELPTSEQDQAIVRAVVQLGRSFGFGIVAEGVEDKAHADRIAALGCEYAQGYWYARPMPEAELIAFLSAAV